MPHMLILHERICSAQHCASGEPREHRPTNHSSSGTADATHGRMHHAGTTGMLAKTSPMTLCLSTTCPSGDRQTGAPPCISSRICRQTTATD